MKTDLKREIDAPLEQFRIVKLHSNVWFWPQAVVRLVIHSTTADDPMEPLKR
jgi:hypothetical protein